MIPEPRVDAVTLRCAYFITEIFKKSCPNKSVSFSEMFEMKKEEMLHLCIKFRGF